MSDSVRTYSGTSHAWSVSDGSLNRRGTGAVWRYVALALIFLLLAYTLWTVRDSQPMEGFVPSHRNMQVYVRDVMNRRTKIAQSRIWDALAEGHPLLAIPETFGAEPVLPEWMLRNFLGSSCHLSADDLEGMSDALLVTRMTPVGVIIERGLRLSTRISADYAGGLRIRVFDEAGLYYAVRGRTLLVSPSRRTLVFALTMDGEEAAPRAEVAQALAEDGAEDLRGTIRLAYEDPYGNLFASVSFAILVEHADARIDVQAVLRPEAKRKLARVLGKAKPQPLQAPIKGPLAVSANLGVSVENLWKSIGDIFEWDFFSEKRWDEWEAGEGGSFARSLTSFLGPLGPGVRLTWNGVDLNEILPVPELIASFDGDEAEIQRNMQALPGPPQGPAFVEPYMHYDTEARQVRLPTVSGPSMELTGGWREGALLFSTSRNLAHSYLESAGSPAYLPEAGNLYVSLSPLACFDLIRDTGHLLAENGLLKGYTPISFEEKAAAWREKVAVIEDITLRALLEDEVLETSIHFVCSQGE